MFNVKVINTYSTKKINNQLVSFRTLITYQIEKDIAMYLPITDYKLESFFRLQDKAEKKVIQWICDSRGLDPLEQKFNIDYYSNCIDQ